MQNKNVNTEKVTHDKVYQLTEWQVKSMMKEAPQLTFRLLNALYNAEDIYNNEYLVKNLKQWGLIDEVTGELNNYAKTIIDEYTEVAKEQFGGLEL
jgi:hypothetical protein